MTEEHICNIALTEDAHVNSELDDASAKLLCNVLYINQGSPLLAVVLLLLDLDLDLGPNLMHSCGDTINAPMPRLAQDSFSQVSIVPSWRLPDKSLRDRRIGISSNSHFRSNWLAVRLLEICILKNSPTVEIPSNAASARARLVE